jgi:carbon-monoxide dehydrogenase medium subunit
MAPKYCIREYFQPETLQEASELLSLYPEATRILAGGTDLLNRLPHRSEKDIIIISLKRIPDLRGITMHDPGDLFIGAMNTHADVAGSSIILREFPALAKASSVVGSPSIRNLGTIGGNIVNASPAADTASPLLVYQAKAVVWSPHGEKQIPVEEFITGPSSTVLAGGEILKGFILKKEGLKACYEKLGIRKAQEIAIVNVCASLGSRTASRVTEIRIALGAVAPTAFRARKAEAYLQVDRITGTRIAEAGQIAASESRPISDTRASADYRREMVAVMVEKLIMSLIEK